jgi:hypothetical protein
MKHEKLYNIIGFLIAAIIPVAPLLAWWNENPLWLLPLIVPFAFLMAGT